MRKALLVLMFLPFAAKTFGQDYSQKSKNQKTVAWVLLGSGTACLIGGLLVDNQVSNDVNPGSIIHDVENAGTREAFFIAGGVCVAASIPFFISSGKNRRLAGEVGMANQKTYMLARNYLAIKHIPGVTLKVSF